MARDPFSRMDDSSVPSRGGPVEIPQIRDSGCFGFKPKVPDTYLGDGLYAAYDGYQIRLYTERADGEHEVFLDDTTLVAFEAFVAALRERAKEAK